MLRELFGEPGRKEEGLLAEAYTALRGYREALHRYKDKAYQTMDAAHQTNLRKLDVWTNGFYISLDELEQSLYIAAKYADRVCHSHLQKMDPEQKNDYFRYVYYFKNGFIRVFSLLDKLGCFMNEWFELNTGAVKSKYSYFTVCRHMYENKLHPALERDLFAIKTAYEQPVGKLRSLRNTEMHLMNAELIDDLSYTSEMADQIPLENIRANIADLDQGYVMVCQILRIVFDYASRHFAEWQQEKALRQQ